MLKLPLRLLILSALIAAFSAQAEPIPRVGSFLGGNRRDFSGADAPSRLDILWRIPLGESESGAYGEPHRVWKGAGWTGQPLIVTDDTPSGPADFIIQGAYDQSLRKIRARDGVVIWRVLFDDILKATGTFCRNPDSTSAEDAWLILQGSRRGARRAMDDPLAPSLRAVSWTTGRVLWELNVRPTVTDSRDVDGSPAVIGSRGYLALENSLFTIFDIAPARASLRDGILQPRVIKEIPFFSEADIAAKGQDLACESSPTLLGRHLYSPAGNGVLYGYNLDTGVVDWTLDLGDDLNGSAVPTPDGCLLVAMEKQFLPGNGGVFKIDPRKPPEKSILWFAPTENVNFFHWFGGVIGSPAVNDTNLAAFIGVDGWLTIVAHDEIDQSHLVAGPRLIQQFPTPRVVFRQHVGGTIATPVFAGNRLIAALDRDIRLFQQDSGSDFREIARLSGRGFDATPSVWNKRIYIASRDGWLYCLGNR